MELAQKYVFTKFNHNQGVQKLFEEEEVEYDEFKEQLSKLRDKYVKTRLNKEMAQKQQTPPDLLLLGTSNPLVSSKGECLAKKKVSIPTHNQTQPLLQLLFTHHEVQQCSNNTQPNNNNNTNTNNTNDTNNDTNNNDNTNNTNIPNTNDTNNNTNDTDTNNNTDSITDPDPIPKPTSDNEEKEKNRENEGEGNNPSPLTKHNNNITYITNVVREVNNVYNQSDTKEYNNNTTVITHEQPPLSIHNNTNNQYNRHLHTHHNNQSTQPHNISTQHIYYTNHIHHYDNNYQNNYTHYNDTDHNYHNYHDD